MNANKNFYGKISFLAVYSENPGLSDALCAAEKLGAEVYKSDEAEENENTSDNDKLWLRYDNYGLALCGNGLVLRGDFLRLLPRLKENNLRSEIIVKAAKSKSKTEPANFSATDATAGLGEDSFLLAAAGYTVDLYEYDTVIAALLRDSLRRARESDELRAVAERMTLHEADSIKELPKLTASPGIIILDPMFPERRKSSLVKKKFQLLQRLELPCGNESTLLAAALAAKPRKIIIKRPSKGGFLAGRKPDYSLERGGIRYDCITNID